MVEACVGKEEELEIEGVELQHVRNSPSAASPLDSAVDRTIYERKRSRGEERVRYLGSISGISATESDKAETCDARQLDIVSRSCLQNHVNSHKEARFVGLQVAVATEADVVASPFLPASRVGPAVPASGAGLERNHAPGTDEGEAGDGDDGKHLESLYVSMVKQQEWLGAEISRIKEQLERRRRHRKHRRGSQSMDDLRAFHGHHDKKATKHHSERPQRVFRDDTAIALPTASMPRLLSEPEAQSVEPMSADMTLRKVESQKRLKSTAEMPLDNDDADQLSLCVQNGNTEVEKAGVDKSEQASPISPRSPRSAVRRQDRVPVTEEMTTDDSVDMLRRYNRKVNHSQTTQHTSGRSSYEHHRDHDRDRHQEVDYRYPRQTGSGSCPDLLMRGHSHVATPVLPMHSMPPYRSFSPQLNVVGASGYPMGSVVPGWSPGFYVPGTQPIQQMPTMHPQNYYGAVPAQQHFDIQQRPMFQPIPSQVTSPIAGVEQMPAMSSAMTSMYGSQPMLSRMQMQMMTQQSHMAPMTASTPIGHSSQAAQLKDILSEAARIQNDNNNNNMLSSSQAAIRTTPRNKNINDRSLDDNNLHLPGQQTFEREATVPSLSLPTPRVAPSVFSGDDQPVAEIQDLNLTPEELESLFEGLDELTNDDLVT